MVKVIIAESCLAKPQVRTHGNLLNFLIREFLRRAWQRGGQVQPGIKQWLAVARKIGINFGGGPRAQHQSHFLYPPREWLDCFSEAARSAFSDAK